MFDSASSPVDPVTKRLLNSGSAGPWAEIGIMDNDFQLIDLTNNQNSPSATINGNTATLNFIAHYYAKQSVSAGSVQSHVMYRISYN